jgi:sialate O-acetylesterase
VRIQFDQIDAGLVAPRKNLRGISIAGADKKFVWAQAVINGEEVVVWSDEVKKPLAVRYGWADNPVCNL